MKRLLFVMIVLVLASSCSKEEASLVGSLGDFYELRHDAVRARLYESELAIEFVRENFEVPVRVTVSTTPKLEPGEYDLAERGDVTGRSDGVDIPRFRTGALRLDRYEGVGDTRISGDFDATFDTGKDVASLAGLFDTTLVVIDSVEGYDGGGDYPDLRQFK